MIDSPSEGEDVPSRWSSFHRFTEQPNQASMSRPPMDQNLPTEIYRLPAERRELIFRVRRQIAEGKYETPQKMELAFERMLQCECSDNSNRPQD